MSAIIITITATAHLKYILVNRLLRLLGALAQGLDELLHGGARDEGPHDPPTLLQSHPHNLPNNTWHYKLKFLQ